MTTAGHRVAFGILSAVGVVLGWRLWSMTPAGPPPLVPASVQKTAIPYTVTREEVVIRRGRAEPTGVETTDAVRSDGSTMKRIERLSTGPQMSSRLVLLASGTRIEADDIRETAVRSHFDGALAFATIRDPEERCLKSLLGKPVSSDEAFGGERHVGSKRVVEIRSQSVVSWLAIEEGCAPIAVRRTSDDGAVEQRLLSIKSGEPDASLFLVSEDYVEVTPSQMRGLDPSTARAQHLDRQYRANRIRQ